MSTLDGSIVNVAMPTFADPAIMPKGSFALANWVYVGFTLTSTAALLTAGRLGDIVGRRRVYIAGMLLFTVASGLCGFAADIHWLIAARVLQALGSAMLLSNGASLLVEAFPPQQRGRALGLFGTVVALGLSSGAPLGGMLLTQPDRWPILFLINLPIGIFGALLCLWALPKRNPSASARLDLRGAVLLAVFAGSLGALIESFREGFSPERSLGLAAVAALSGFVFHRVETRQTNAIIDFDLLLSRVFGGGSLALLFTFAALPASVLLIPYYLHDLGRVPMSYVGIVMLAGPLALSVGAPLAGAFSDRIGTRMPTVAGMIIAAAGYTLLAFGLTDAPRPFDVFWRSFIVGIGMGLFTAPNSSAVMGATPRDRLGLASGMLGTMRNLGAAIGGAVCTVLFASTFAAMAGAVYTADVARANPAAMLSALRAAFLVSAAFAITSAILSALLPSVPPERGPLGRVEGRT
jgi:EmrB/QacA subfamily drug resistance transporter